MSQDAVLLRPQDDEPAPELSIVIPALNEQLTITTFVQWCKEGLARAGVKGEILIVDSSTDDTPNLAVAAGARVLQVPKRGLGRAYIDAMPHVRGRWVLMGDADCTYDFRELKPFVEAFRAGNEFIMGSRFLGYIEPGAMPPLHRYFGTPVTTFILNLLFGSRFSDIHCGMRGITRDAFGRIELSSQSWEYASEMVLKSVHLKLRTAEVPIRFLKDVEGRESHHRRAGWFSPWQAGWINLKAMFIYGADFFLFWPGVVLLAVGALLTLPTTVGPVTLGPITFSLYWKLLGLSVVILGMQCLYMGILARVLFDYRKEAARRWLARFPYTPVTWGTFVLFFAGVGLGLPLATEYVANGYTLPAALDAPKYLAVSGLLAMVTAFMTFTFMLILHATQVAAGKARPS